MFFVWVLYSFAINLCSLLALSLLPSAFSEFEMDLPTEVRPAPVSSSNSCVDEEKAVQPELEYASGVKHDNGLSDQTFYLPRRKIITASDFIT